MMGIWDQETEGYESNPTRALPIVSPANMMPVQVIGREMAAPGVVTVYIVLPGTHQAPAPYLPGQFVTLALPTPRDTLYRSYSLCGDGDASQPWELTIKQLEQGASSTYFYKHVTQDTLLYSSLPRGTFTLPATIRPELCLVMVAAGSGITPIMGMLRFLDRLPEEQRPFVHLHYASKSVEDIIFGDELADMDRSGAWLRQWHYLSSERERMTANAILERSGNLASRAHWYMCGPDALKRDLQAQLRRLRVPSEYIHSEVFATAPGPAYRVASNGAGGKVRVVDTGVEFDVSPQETLLTALEREGYRPNFNCRAGACGECKLRVLEGQVDLVGEVLSDSEREAGYVLSCIARPIGTVTLASGGRPPAGVRRVAAAIADPLAGASRRALRAGRVAALAGAGALLLGAWTMTDHRPASWDTVQAASSVQSPMTTATTDDSATPAASATTATTATTGTGTGTGATASPTATRSSGGGGGGGGAPAPTATTSAGGGGGGGAPAPTATPAPKPTATPAPKPTPTCVSKPSKPC
jgi:ferredoxin-NADP reductase